ncbi:MAG: glycosyltransferase family 2 protein [Solirubrobacteraceae bacterium]
MISVCVAVYRPHPSPNVSELAVALDAALGGHDGELVVALNGIGRELAGVPAGVRAIDLGTNRGVAPAWNAAAQAADGETLVFCNDDVELGARSLAHLEDALRRFPDTVVGPVGSSWDIARGRHIGWVQPDEVAPGELVECDVVSGFLFACARHTWAAVGGFDEFYAPASWEEVDFCTAVRATGGRCFAVSGVQVGHEWGVSRRQLPWARARWGGRSETWRSIHRRNRLHFLEKWGTQPMLNVSVDSGSAR